VTAFSAPGYGADEQDAHAFLRDYRKAHPQDVLVLENEVCADQDVTAVADALARQGRWPLLWFERVKGFGSGVATNLFGSRERIARILGASNPRAIHET